MRFRKRSIPLLAIKPFRVDGAMSGLISLGLDKVETGYNLLMEFKFTYQMLSCSFIRTGLPAVSFYLFGATLSLIFKKVTFYK